MISCTNINLSVDYKRRAEKIHLVLHLLRKTSQWFFQLVKCQEILTFLLVLLPEFQATHIPPLRLRCINFPLHFCCFCYFDRVMGYNDFKTKDASCSFGLAKGYIRIFLKRRWPRFGAGFSENRFLYRRIWKLPFWKEKFFWKSATTTYISFENCFVILDSFEGRFVFPTYSH